MSKKRRQSKIDWQCLALCGVKACCTSMIHHVQNHEFLSDDQMKELEDVYDRLLRLSSIFVLGYEPPTREEEIAKMEKYLAERKSDE